MHAATGTPRGVGRAGRAAERPVVLKTRGNARRRKGPQVWRDDGGAKARGSGFAYDPRLKGQRVSRSITCVSEGAGLAGLAARCRQGVNRLGGTSERGTAGEAVQLLGAGATQSRRYREGPLRTGVPLCERHDPTGEPDAGNPHVRFGGQGVETDVWEPD